MKRLLRTCFMVIYVPYCKFRKGVIIKGSVIINKKTNLSRGCVVHSKSIIANTSIGTGTYVGIGCSLIDCEIGKFCAIAHNVEMINATHPTRNFVSIHPAFFSTKKQSGFTYADEQIFEERKYIDKTRGICVKIGNDVWIGAHVIIIGGVTIGDGAIIATGSVVTKDVEPYSIIGGVPAKHIRYRFNEEQIQFLLGFKWWDKSPEWLKANVDKFEDIDKFMQLKRQ